MDKWINFYQSFFSTREEATEFVESLECLGPGDQRYRAKIMMHQAQRLVTLADDMPKVRPGKDALQLLFLMVCAENIAKLFDHFEGEGQSRKYVRRFFEEFVVGADRQAIERSIMKDTFPPLALNLGEVVDTLYSVRCDVVHEGQYWGFQFHDGDTPMITGDPPVTVYLELSTLRDVVVRAAIRAIRGYAAPESR
jgi:hypothetical protein